LDDHDRELDEVFEVFDVVSVDVPSDQLLEDGLVVAP
jgi:hypothetical protein